MAMTMTQVFETFAECGLRDATSGPYGVTWGPLRVESGSGIAGRGGIWTIKFPGAPELKAIGPIASKRALRAALKELITECLALMMSVHRAVRGLDAMLPDDEEEV